MDEIIFFEILQKVVGPTSLKAKVLGTPVSAKDVFLQKDFYSFSFIKHIEQSFQEMLKRLLHTPPLPAGPLSHNVDGMLLNHSTLGTRIIEFDEEQHFNPFRKASLLTLEKHVELEYAQRFNAICDNTKAFREMLRKHRVKIPESNVPEDVPSFLKFIERAFISESGYTGAKPGFRFLGGRLAQRAYYDALRDTAHLSVKNSGFSPALRFAKFEFEEKYGKKFSLLRPEEIMRHIQHRLNSL